MAVQVVDLVAEAPSDHAFILYLKLVAAAILCLDLHLHGTGHFPPVTGQGQAAFQAGLLAGAADDLRIHQFNHVLVPVQQHHHTAADANLGGCQTHTAGLFQGLGHVVQQTCQLVVKLGHGVALFLQYGIAFFYNRL